MTRELHLQARKCLYCIQYAIVLYDVQISLRDSVGPALRVISALVTTIITVTFTVTGTVTVVIKTSKPCYLHSESQWSSYAVLIARARMS